MHNANKYFQPLCRRSGKTKDVAVDGVTVAFDGKVLLNRTVLRIANGHRYGLIGHNGVGKTTLMRRIAAEAVPGWPLHISTLYVQQEVMASSDTVIESMQAVTTDASAALEQERQELEEQIEEVKLRRAAHSSFNLRQTRRTVEFS